MPKYKYSAIDHNGKEKRGKLDADSDSEASAQLAAQGLMVMELTPLKGKAKKAKASADAGGKGGKKGFSLSFGTGVNSETLTIFSRQLATLLQAGLPLMRSLEIMARQEKNEKFKAIIDSILETVQGGSPFSDGLAQHPKVFDDLYINMIKAGEAGGVLDVVLDRLAGFMEKSLKTKKKVKSAMMYPVIVLSFTLVIVAVLMAVVVPKFQAIFKDMLGANAKLPALTEFVVGISEFVQNNLIASVGILVVLWFGFKFLLKTKKGARLFDILKLRTPKFGELGTKAAVSRFTRTFGTLLASGVAILEALKITRDVIGNVLIADALDEVHNRVRDGEPLATPLDQTGVFPTMVTSMIEVGEETGDLATMLTRIADNYDEDLDNAVAGITSLIEPIMIIFLAVVVGTIVIALFLPIIELVTQIG